MKKILIIEDDAVVAHIYKSRLEKEGFVIEIASDGQTGFYRIHEFKPDAVLLDLMLPKMNGVDILKKIRAQKQYLKLPIIVFTNAYVTNMIQDATQAGATRVFNKASLTPRQITEALNLAITASSELPPTTDTAFFKKPDSTPPGTSIFTKAPAANGDAPLPGIAAESNYHPSPHETSAPFLPAVALSVLPVEHETAFLDELYNTFKQTGPQTLAALRKVLLDFSKAPTEESRQPHLEEMYRSIHALTSNAGVAGVKTVAQIASALEALLKDLVEKPKNVNASTLRTVASTVDLLADLLCFSRPHPVLEDAAVNVMVVDDEILSRRAITFALEKASLKAVSLESSDEAFTQAQERVFDLIFLDVQMPVMDGFDLCTKIRTTHHNKSTPVIFVTSLSDFKSRARSTLSGGNELIAKPFLFIELAVKALTTVLRNRLSQARAEAA